MDLVGSITKPKKPKKLKLPKAAKTKMPKPKKPRSVKAKAPKKSKGPSMANFVATRNKQLTEY